MDNVDRIRLECELELFKTVFLLSVIEGLSLESALKITCIANRDIMEMMNIFPLDICKHFFRISIVAREIQTMSN